MQESFTIKQQSFEGPLELLLSLIEKRKLHISDVALSKVADDYISYVKQYENMPVAESAHFILIASTLTLIKSKALLPMLDLTEEEQGDIEDLENRLREYKRIKELSIHVQNMFGKSCMFPKNHQGNIEPVFSPEEGMNTNNIVEAIKRVLRSLPKKEVLQKTVVDKVISLEEMIDKLTNRVMGSLKMSFSDFSGKKSTMTKEEKVNVVVSFLAMLELVKEGIVSVVQDKRFDDIQIETQNVGLPTYE
ncbi:MAG: segregation/condensation protein A [Candidatus Pacebacteria bacterium]|nr:segregation/condensation protein A [Candidatus Paceibacterota bacterium]